MTSKKAAQVVWELSDEGRVVVDVDVPLRPFGSMPTPPKGTLAAKKKDGTEPDGVPVEDFGDLSAPPNVDRADAKKD